MTYPPKLKEEAIRLHKEEGRSAEWIAEKFSKEQPPNDRPAPRTVRKWLENHKRIQQEKAFRSELERGTYPVFAKAKEEHLNSIRKLIQEWHDNLKQVGSMMSSVRAEDLVDIWFEECFTEDWLGYDPAFQENVGAHLPFPDLWDKHNEWWGKLSEYSKNISMLEDIIRKEGESWQVRLGEHFVYPALMVLDSEYTGYSHRWGKFTYMKPSFLCDGDELIVEYFKEHWSILEANKPEQYIARYESMVKRLIESSEVNKLFSIRKTINELMLQIRNRLSNILERRDYIWYTCPRCPSPPVP
jgi:hypothetical protein